MHRLTDADDGGDGRGVERVRSMPRSRGISPATPAMSTPALFGPAHDLGGGSTDVDAAIQWMIDTVRGCTNCATKVDVVILRSSGSNGYNDYIYAMNGVDSVETLVITAAKDSNTAAVETTVKNAEVVFFAGGDQCDYVKNFKGTKVETAVESVYARGGAVGGTSAGLADPGRVRLQRVLRQRDVGDGPRQPVRQQRHLHLRLLQLGQPPRHHHRLALRAARPHGPDDGVPGAADQGRPGLVARWRWRSTR